MEDIRTIKDNPTLDEFKKKYTKPYCIVLDSEYSSMGRMIGLGMC